MNLAPETDTRNTRCSSREVDKGGEVDEDKEKNIPVTSTPRARICLSSPERVRATSSESSCCARAAMLSFVAACNSVANFNSS